MGTFIKEGNGMTFNEAIDQLMENIKITKLKVAHILENTSLENILML